MKVTRLASESHIDTVEEGHDGKRKYYWIVRDQPQKNIVEGTDMWAMSRNRASITPIHSNLSCPDHAPALQTLVPALLSAVKGSPKPISPF